MAKNIIVYSTDTWPWCIRVKDYLNANNISFVEHNVQKDREKAIEMVQKSGQQGVPVLDIDGTIVVGFDKDKIDSLVGL